MGYKIKNTFLSAKQSLITNNNIEQVIHETLAIYDKGEDLTNSPWIQSEEGLHHQDVYHAKNKESVLQKRQQEIISLYHSIKKDGYNGSPILAWFDNDGYIHLYDGFTRIAIMSYLNMDEYVNVETNWEGVQDGADIGKDYPKFGRDFPLVETLMNEAPAGAMLYQPVDDYRLKGWKLDRPDSPKRFEYIKENLVGKTVLDIGCSEGYFSRELAKAGYKVTAIDKSRGLIAAARYLSIINSLDIKYQVGEWEDMVKQNGHFDNILFLSVLHNDMKRIGVQKGLEKLQSFRGKAKRVFFEVPNNENERQWMRDGYPKFNFHTSGSILEHNMGMAIKDRWHNLRSIFLMQSNKHKAKLNEQVFGCVSKEDIVYEPDVNGYPMYLFKDEKWITPAILRSHKYEPETTMLLKQWLKEGDTFLDAGANVGYYTILASKIVGDKGKVYAFEPVKENFKLLQANIELNDCKNVIAFQKALTNKKGQTKLFKVKPKSYGEQYLEEVLQKYERIGWDKYDTKEILNSDKYEIVETVRLDEVLTEAPDIIKVDVEGAERLVFEGMGDLLNKTQTIFVEDTTGVSKWLSENFGFEIIKPHYEISNYLLSKVRWDADKWLKARGAHYKAIFDILKSQKFCNIMEIGTFNGDSAIGLIKTAAIRAPEEQIHYYGFDLFEEKTPQLVAEEFSFARAPLVVNVAAKIKQQTKAKVSLFKGNTRQTLPAVVNTLPKMDFIYIDGGHTIETVRNDWEYASKLMKPSTVVMFDDYCDEMPFIGAKFLIDELDKSKYATQVMPEVDYYPRAFGRFKSQLLKVQLKQSTQLIVATPSNTHLRFHILGVPHTKTNKEYFICPFTELTYGMCQMMTELGHEVYHYGAEGSDVPCTEHVNVLSDAIQREAYGDFDWHKHYWKYSGNDLAYTTFAKNAIEEINKRKGPRDMLLTVSGKHHKGIADATDLMTVEYAIGYEGVFSKYKVFASYAWMHYIYGKLAKGNLQNGACNGNWYDAVIPHYFNPSEFKYREKKEEYYLYLGRVIPRKGVHIAAQTCERIGAKLVVIGQLVSDSTIKDLGLDKPHVEYIGTVTNEERSEFMSKAKAVFTPTVYLEPFGMTVIEALMCGTPVISTDWGAFVETVAHGRVGYRCRTMDDFVWAAKNIDKINPAECRKYAEDNYSMSRLSKVYQEYYMKLQDLYGKGWYAEHPERKDLDWLRRY